MDPGTARVGQLALALTNLEQVLREHAVPVVEHLAPGLPGDAVEAAARGVGLDPHPDLLTWWAWHDGATTDQWRPEFCLLSALWPMPLAVAVSAWHVRADDPLWEEGTDPPRHLFPVAGIGGRSVVGVDTIDGSVVIDDPHSYTDPPFTPQWQSLTAMVQEIATVWRRGTVQMHPDGGPLVDRSRWPAEVPRNSIW